MKRKKVIKKEHFTQPASGELRRTGSEDESLKLTTGRSFSSAAFGSKKYLRSVF
jgi:hypothetical protein